MHQDHSRCDASTAGNYTFAACGKSVDKGARCMLRAPDQFDMRDDHLDLRADLQGIISGGEPRHSILGGVKGLFLAVLEDGIRSYLRPVPELRAEAEYWVSSSRARSPFAFVVICETLGLEPAAVRDALQRLRVQRVGPGRVIGRTRPNVRRANRVTQRKAG